MKDCFHSSAQETEMGESVYIVVVHTLTTQKKKNKKPTLNPVFSFFPITHTIEVKKTTSETWM